MSVADKTSYQSILAELLTSELRVRLGQSEPGHCLRLEGLPSDVLHAVTSSLQSGVPGAKVVLLATQPREPYEVTATKLVELRNLAESSHVLMVLIPSNLRTAAEDSFDRATFRQVEISSLPSRVLRRLEDEIPAQQKVFYERVKNFFGNTGRPIAEHNTTQYLLSCLEGGFAEKTWGHHLYQLGLIPDDALLDAPENIEQRLHRNALAVECLRNQSQPLVARIAALEVEPNSVQKSLYQFLSSQGRPEDPERWGGIIARDPALEALNLKHWPFTGLRSAQELELFVEPLKGKSVTYEEGEKRVITKENREVKISLNFSTVPGPMEIPALTHFRIDLMRTGDGRAIEKVESLLKFKKTAGGSAKRTKQVPLDPSVVTEGVYFFRVQALDEAGTILNRNDPFRDTGLQAEWRRRRAESGEAASRDDLQGKLTSDTEDFFFRIEGSQEDMPENKGTGGKMKAASLSQAVVRARLDYVQANQLRELDSLKITERAWTDRGEAQRKDCSLVVNFNDVRHNYEITLASSVRALALQILRAPDKLGQFRLDFSADGGVGHGVPHLRDNQLGDDAPAYFLKARREAFEAVLSQVSDTESGVRLGVVESCDFLQIQEQIEAYLATYNQWAGEVLGRIKEHLDEHSLSVVKRLQLLDFAEINFAKAGGRRERAFVMTPLHPLRLAWFLQLQLLYRDWERRSLSESKPGSLWTDEVKTVFLGGLQPADSPLVVNGGNLRSFYYSGEVATGWGLYVPVIPRSSAEPAVGSRAMVGAVQNLLGIPSALREGSDFSVTGIYQQLFRYLLQHPYVDVLHVNAFNPGDGWKLVECLVRLQANPLFKDMRYEVRFIAPAERLGEAGAAFDEFLNPTGAISDEADAFTVPSANTLFPKLRFSKNSIDDYQRDPEGYEAHVSLVFDLFPVEVKLIKPVPADKQSLWCHGLVVNPVNSFNASGEDVLGWDHYLAVNATPPISDTDSVTGALVGALGLTQQLVAVALAGRWTQDLTALSLLLKDASRTLIYQIHEYSDWVVTVDRNLGVDLFDSPTGPETIPYLLDYSPGSGLNEPPVFLTTRPSSEIYGLLVPHLIRLGLADRGDATSVTAFLEKLRSLSGSVLMQLLSSPTRAFEAVGIGLARMLLEHLGLLGEHFLIPLDMHRDIFEDARKSSDENRTLQRGDFLLVSCDPAADTIYFQVIEVKCRTFVGAGSVLTNLREKMTEQLDATVSALQLNFDPSLRIPDRLDRNLKTRQLFHLLDFYLNRARRYGLIREEAFGLWKHFLSQLHAGYKLSFNRVGLIFEFEGEQKEVDTHSEAPDLTFFHAGRALIRRLFDSLASEGEPLGAGDVVPLTPEMSTVRSLITRGHESPPPRPVTSVELQGEMNDGVPVLQHLPAAVAAAATSTPSFEVPHDAENARPTSVTGHPPDAREVEPRVEGVNDSPVSPENVEDSPPNYTDMIGDAETTPQYGLLASTDGNRRIALDLNGCNTISLFGVPGGGKSYTVGSVVEMATQKIPGINRLPSPLATVVFHYNESQDYPPEFVSMRYANDHEREVEVLKRVYGAAPDSLKDVLLLVPRDKIELRRREYPDVAVSPIAFSSQELSIKDWKFLMGALGNQALYIQVLNMIMRREREGLTLDRLRDGIEKSNLSDSQKDYAYNRLELAAQFIDDSARMRDLLRPGRMVVVDLRDEFIEKEQALGLFVVMLNIFSGAKLEDGSPFNKLIVFDEAHKYITHSDLTSHVVEVIRQMRHQGVTMLIASQDPPSLPSAVIELSSAIILHRFNSPQWLKHVQKSVTALDGLTTSQLASLQPGEAYLWANKATNPEWTKKAIKVVTRPRVTLHGGSTQKAVG